MHTLCLRTLIISMSRPHHPPMREEPRTRLFILQHRKSSIKSEILRLGMLTDGIVETADPRWRWWCRSSSRGVLSRLWMLRLIAAARARVRSKDSVDHFGFVIVRRLQLSLEFEQMAVVRLAVEQCRNLTDERVQFVDRSLRQAPLEDAPVVDDRVNDVEQAIDGVGDGNGRGQLTIVVVDELYAVAVLSETRAELIEDTRDAGVRRS